LIALAVFALEFAIKSLYFIIVASGKLEMKLLVLITIDVTVSILVFCVLHFMFGKYLEPRFGAA
jgi:hypothetical protein